MSSVFRLPSSVFCFCFFISFQLQAQLNSEQLIRVHNFSSVTNLNNVANPLAGNLACVQNNFYYYDGSQWRTVWNTLGNDNIGTNNFLGTTNNAYLKFYTNNVKQMVVGYGRIGINTGSPGHPFHIDGGSTSINDDFIIATNGNVGVGVVPTEKLHVNGNILANGTITPDYVFEHYFEGRSVTNPNYKFLTLEEVEYFVKNHKHLPGVPSAKEIKQQGGILVNKATEINLEKIEELHLYLFELYEEQNEIEMQLIELENRIK
ncbi:MAG: hypothetical protein ISP71_02340 [Flavobacteriales bacterium]|nr:hypothetical protein [Flavobacteriales bacterium]